MRENECPVKLTVDLIGGKWKTLILYYLKRGPKRTGVLQQRIEGVSKKMLTQQLRELERDGLIKRKDYGEVPPRVEYALTPHGETLRPILGLMAAWGARHRARYARSMQELSLEHKGAIPVKPRSPGASLSDKPKG
jgi:DNA-binding HxlR family transcriptional regulator